MIIDLIWNWYNHHREHPDVVPHDPTHRITLTWCAGRVQTWDIMWCRIWDTMTPTEEWHGYTAEDWRTRRTSVWSHRGPHHRDGEHLARRDGRFAPWHGCLEMARIDGSGARLIGLVAAPPAGTCDALCFLDLRVRLTNADGEVQTGTVWQGDDWENTGGLVVREGAVSTPISGPWRSIGRLPA
jgi:hypothetical protein